MWEPSFVTILAVFLWLPLRLDAQAVVPDVKFEVAVHRLVDGTREPSFHLLQLSCTSGRCTLVTVSFAGPWSCELGTLTPTVELASTDAGELLVSSSGTEIVVRDLTWASDLAGESSPAIYVFHFSPAGAPGKITALTGFSGGFTRASSILGRVRGSSSSRSRQGQ